MKKITDMLLDDNRRDPSQQYEEDLKELIVQLKINMISYQDNPEILYNIYAIMKTYLSEAVVNEIIDSCLTDAQFKQIHRDMILNFILK